MIACEHTQATLANTSIIRDRGEVVDLLRSRIVLLRKRKKRSDADPSVEVRNDCSERDDDQLQSLASLAPLLCG